MTYFYETIRSTGRFDGALKIDLLFTNGLALLDGPVAALKAEAIWRRDDLLQQPRKSRTRALLAHPL